MCLVMGGEIKEEDILIWPNYEWVTLCLHDLC
jgi:hypothetical protein